MVADRRVSTDNRKTHKRDSSVTNAARNILTAAHAILASGESMLSGNSMKQEPAKASPAQS